MAELRRYYPESQRPAPATDGYSQAPMTGWGSSPAMIESLAQRSHDLSNAMTTQPYTSADLGAHGDAIQSMWRRSMWSE